MLQYEILKIQEHPALKQDAAQWFHEKWGIPLEAYLDSMDECLNCTSAVPQWYIVKNKDEIIGGLGVIENDFHDRKDLTPNVCAVYVEQAYRCQGIAGEMLDYVCKDMNSKGIDTLYLVTDHTSFYERYGWEFLCMVQGDGEPDMTRMYVHRM
ncbi:MAG: GNAT family N-acetyltransferase [Lachnospiraceae bacterium]|nr:GNAT family N-acetyltransferase [Lachnospiraceae bacterium]